MSASIWSKTKIRNENRKIVDAIAPIIISASRSTDIPAFYAEWFVERLNGGFVKWKNPFNNTEQYVSFSKTRLIVFWTKNAKPIIPYLKEIDELGIQYYFQFTLNDYEKEGLEPNVPSLKDRIETFRGLSNIIGKDRVIWRFDPLVLTDQITIEKLIDKIMSLGNELQQYTNKLVISFADISVYKKVRDNLKRENVQYTDFDVPKMIQFAEKLNKVSLNWPIEIATCSEEIDLGRFGIKHNKCIDDNLIIRLFNKDKVLMRFLGADVKKKDLRHYENENEIYATSMNLKDRGQRNACGCIVSKDIGQYNTCRHLCKYCYANYSNKIVLNNIKRHNIHGEGILCEEKCK